MPLKSLKRGFKTLATKRKGKKAAKLAKQLKTTRGVKLRNLAVQRKARKRRAKKLLN